MSMFIHTLLSSTFKQLSNEKPKAMPINTTFTAGHAASMRAMKSFWPKRKPTTKNGRFIKASNILAISVSSVLFA